MAALASHPLAQPPPGEAPPGGGRALAIAIGANVLGITAHTTYMYYLAPIALREGGIVGRDALAFSLVAVAMGLAVVPAGRLADRVPRRRVMRAGLALLGLSYLALLPTPTLPVILGGVVLSGVGLALLFVSFNSYVADLLSGSARGRAYGKAGALSVLASAAGPFVAATTLRFAPDALVGLRANAALFGLGAFVGIALTWALPSMRAQQAPAERGSARETLRVAAPLMALYAVQGLAYGMTAPYFTVYFLDHVRLPRDAWGYVLAAGTLASAVGSFFAGRALARHAPPRVMLAGQVGLLLSCALLAFPVPVALLVVGFLGRSLFSTTTGPSVNVLLMARAVPARRAEAQSYSSLAWNAGWAVGATLGAVALVRLDGRAFVVGATLGLLGVALGVALLRRD